MQHEVADDVALDDGEAAAVVEVGDGDAGRGAVDQVAVTTTAPSNANSTKIATSPMRAMLLERICTLEALVGADGGEGAVGDAVAR